MALVGPCSQPYISQHKLEEQIGRELRAITVSDDFRCWALKHVQAAHGQETKARTRMYQSQQAAYNAAQKQLDRLVDMHLQDLIAVEEYGRKRGELQRTMASLKLKMVDSEDRAKRWLELTEQAVFFVNRAKKVFDQGSDEKRREIVVGLGSNFVLKDKKIRIELHEPFKWVKNANLENNPARLSPRSFAAGSP